MNYESNRLRTFQKWPIIAPISSEKIAEAGFYYTGYAQVVQCFLCGVQISKWNLNDIVTVRHQQASPECPFVLEPLRTCNVPLRKWRMISQIEIMNYYERLSTFMNWPITEVVSPESLAKSGFIYLQRTDLVECIYCGGQLKHWLHGDVPDHEHRRHFPNCSFYLKEEDEIEKVDFVNVKLLPGTTSNFTELGIQNHLAPKQPKHATYEGRLHTFLGWPTNLNQTPEMLADAGFYYLGSEDQVRCFHCGGGLKNWEENDVAWIEHARWFPKCGYTVLVRGQDFIKHCIENTQSSEPSVLASAADDTSEFSITPSESPVVVSPQRRSVTEAELEDLLGSAPAVAALEIGLHVGRVKMALKRRMELTGLPYANADQLIEDATQIQLREEDNIISNQSPDSPSSELTHLLNQIITTAESSNSTNVETEAATNNETIESTESEEIKTSILDVKSDDDVQQPDDESIKTEETVSLIEENRKLKEARLCRICMDKEFSVVFLPCSHLSTCVFCASSLTHCPMCRQEIRATVRTFLA